MEVLAETKFLFNGDKSSVVHSWEEYGLKLHVPEGSTASFTARVVHSKLFELPEGTKLVSNYFYWVTSEGALTGPVGVETHVAGITDQKGLSTLRFAAYKLEKPKPPYVFEICDFSSTSSCLRGNLQFSDWFFTPIVYFLGCWRQSFIAKVFCEPLAGSTYECRAHIVIVPDTDECQVSATACMQAVSMYYSYNGRWIYVYPHSTDASASLIDNLTCHSRMILGPVTSVCITYLALMHRPHQRKHLALQGNMEKYYCAFYIAIYTRPISKHDSLFS